MALDNTDLFLVQDATTKTNYKVGFQKLQEDVLEDINLDSRVAVAGDNMTGNLTLGTNNITLDANNGSITAAGSIQTGGLPWTGVKGFIATQNGQVYASAAAGSSVFQGFVVGNNTAQLTLTGDGSITAGVNATTNGRLNLRPGSVLDTSLTIASGAGGGDIFTVQNNGSIFANSVGSAGTSPKYKLDGADGSGTFAGKVTSASTEDSDSGTTLVTKDYLEGAGSGGTGALGYWNRTGTALSPVNISDNVGIGTDSPQAKLDVKGRINVTNISDGSNYGEIYDGGGLVIKSHNSNPMYFYTGGTETLRISPNGDVGIGTSAPGTTLELGTETPVLRLNGTNNGANVYGDIRSTGAGFEFLSRGGAAAYGSYAFYNYDGTTESIALKIKSDGNVGIGTDSPGRVFDVQNNDSEIYQVRLTAGATNNSAGLEFTSADASDQWAAIRSSNDELAFHTNANEQLRIDSTGNVGIGTDNPENKLHVLTSTNTAARFASSTRFSTLLFSEIDINKGAFFGTDNGDFRFVTGGDRNGTGATNKVRIKENGYVGIGTDSPLRVLHTVGDGVMVQGPDGDDSEVILRGVNASGNVVSDYKLNHSGTTDNFTLFRNSSKLVTVDNSGNVGIGTDDPERKLHVDGTSFNVARFQSTQTDSRIEFQDANTGKFDTVSIGSNGNDFQINTNVGAVGGTRRVTVKDDGNVGIGTASPAQLLELKKVNPILQITADGDNTAARFGITRYAFADGNGAEIVVSRPSGGVASDSTMQFRVGGSGSANEKMRINTNGNVGIGVTAPQAKLDVNGTVRATAFDLEALPALP